MDRPALLPELTPDELRALKYAVDDVAGLRGVVHGEDAAFDLVVRIRREPQDAGTKYVPPPTLQHMLGIVLQVMPRHLRPSLAGLLTVHGMMDAYVDPLCARQAEEIIIQLSERSEADRGRVSVEVLARNGQYLAMKAA